MATSMYSNGILRPRLPVRLMAFEESRGREREIVTFLVHQPQYIDALASYDLTSQDFVHSTVACKQATSMMDRSGRRMERTADVLVEHSELIAAIELFWKSRGRVTSLLSAIDLLFSNKLAAARAAFDQRQLQVRWEGAKRLVEGMYQTQPVPAEDFFDSLGAMSRVGGKKASKSSRHASRREEEIDDEQEFEFDSPVPEEEEAPRSRRASKKHASRQPIEKVQETLQRQQRPVRPDVLEFDPNHLDPSAPRTPQPVSHVKPVESAPVPQSILHSAPIQPPRGMESQFFVPPPNPPVARSQPPVPQPRVRMQPQTPQSAMHQPMPAPWAPLIQPPAQPESRSVAPQAWPWTPPQHTHAAAPFVQAPPAPSRPQNLAPKIKEFATFVPPAPRSLAPTPSIPAPAAPVRSPLRLPPDMTKGSVQSGGALPSSASSSVRPLSSFSQQMSAQLFAERKVLIPAPCQPLDACLGGGFMTGQVYSISANHELAVDDFLSECADYAALHGAPAVLISSRLTREQSWVRGIARMGKIESRLIEKRPWLSNQTEYSERMKSQIARAVEKYNRLAERVTLIECQPGITISQVKQMAAEVRRFHQLDEAKPIIIAIDTIPRGEDGTADAATALKQLARETSAAVLVVETSSGSKDVTGFAQQLLSNQPAAVAADYSLRIEVEGAGSAAELEQKYLDHPAALSKLRQLRKYFPPDPEGAERSTFAVVSVREPGGYSRQDVVLMYQQAFHNFVGIEKITFDSRGLN